MTTVIIQISIILWLISLRTFACAQDMFVQLPPFGNLPPSAPITLKITVDDESFSSVVWRGLTIQYPRPGQQAITRAPEHIDRTLFNAFSTKPVVDEQKTVREAWRSAFGFDVWGPYYRVKDVEKWVKKKASVKVFKMKGEPIIERGRLMYTFKTTF